MRELCPAEGETIVIDGNVTVTVLEVNGDEVVLAVDAPDWIDVRAQERSETTGRRILALPR